MTSNPTRQAIAMAAMAGHTAALLVVLVAVVARDAPCATSGNTVVGVPRPDSWRPVLLSLV